MSAIPIYRKTRRQMAGQKVYWRDYAKAPGWYYLGESGEHGPYSTREVAEVRGPEDDGQSIADYGEDE